MKPLIYFFIFTIIIATNYAQDSCKVENPHGLQFQIGENFQLTNFDGYTVSYRYFLDKNSGFRFGFLFNISNSDRNGSQIQNYQLPPVYKNSINGDRTLFGLGFSAQYHRLLFNKKNVNFLVGFGPFVYFENLDNVNKSANSTYTFRETEITKQDIQIYGVDGLVGAEYKFSEDFSLSVEVGLLMQYFIRDHNYTKKTTSVLDYSTNSSSESNKSKEKGFEIKGAPVRMGLTLFF
ncbi:MAG: hypothetical protein IPK06_04320 [Ignavibacteriae bacterium]|nr:hypothetical protein [Ignavibacteriota bacterium]